MKLDWSAWWTAAASAAVLALAPLQSAAQQKAAPKEPPPRNTLDTADYNFLIGSGLLCDGDDSSACPAVAGASDGQIIEIYGAGTLSQLDKSVTASGAFAQKNADGDIVITGVWTATALVSVQPYGAAMGALQREYPKLKVFVPPMSMGKLPRSTAALLAGPIAVGGLAVIRIRLQPDRGGPRDAVLEVNSAKGEVPPERPTDGVRLTIDGGPVFAESLGGRALFVIQRPGPNYVWGAPTPPPKAEADTVKEGGTSDHP